METRANHVLIGGFALAVVLAAFGFLIWLGQFEFDKRYEMYEVVFNEAVSGLDVGADVRYNGIRVGEVTQVALDRDDPSKVRVIVQVNEGTPVKQDTVASLESGLLTGVATIQLSGGSSTSVALEPAEGQTYAQIPVEKTGFQEIFAGAPDLIRAGNELLTRANSLFSTDNREAISRIIANVEVITKSLADSGDEIQRILASTDKIAINIERASRNADTLIDQDARRLVREAEASLAEVTSLLRDNRPGIKDFIRGGLPQIVMFIQEARQLFGTLDRVAQKLESDPAAFLLGRDDAEYEGGGQ